jgi:hypothetical protein
MAPIDPSSVRFETDYYAVLAVDARASEEEIRRSYRRLALEAHPDKNPNRREWAETRIRELIVAFEVLSNEDSRRSFDLYIRASGRLRQDQEPFFFHRQTPGCRALLILHHLLKGRASEASDIVEEMEEEYGGSYLYDYLAHSDYLDCLFLLAEHHVREKNFLAASQRLRTFYHLECRAQNPRHYLDQVLDLLRDLYLRRLPKLLEPLLQVTYLLEAAEFRLGKKDEIRRLSLLAEMAARSGNPPVARASIDRLYQMAPELPELSMLEDLILVSVDRDASRRRSQMRAKSAKTSGGAEG